jgi:hypothetical protein
LDFKVFQLPKWLLKRNGKWRKQREETPRSTNKRFAGTYRVRYALTLAVTLLEDDDLLSEILLRIPSREPPSSASAGVASSPTTTSSAGD